MVPLSLFIKYGTSHSCSSMDGLRQVKEVPLMTFAESFYCEWILNFVQRLFYVFQDHYVFFSYQYGELKGLI